jgi:hypothetical protein
MQCLEACPWVDTLKFIYLDDEYRVGVVRYGTALLAHFMIHYRISSTFTITSPSHRE